MDAMMTAHNITDSKEYMRESCSPGLNCADGIVFVVIAHFSRSGHAMMKFRVRPPCSYRWNRIGAARLVCVHLGMGHVFLVAANDSEGIQDLLFFQEFMILFHF